MRQDAYPGEVTATLPPTKLVANYEVIRALRHAWGYNTAELAKLAGVSQPYMHRIEKGVYAGSPRVLKAIAEALHVSVAAITMAKPLSRDTG